MKQKERCEKAEEISVHILHLKSIMNLLENQQKDILNGCTHKLASGQNALGSDGECQVCGSVVRMYTE